MVPSLGWAKPEVGNATAAKATVSHPSARNSHGRQPRQATNAHITLLHTLPTLGPSQHTPRPLTARSVDSKLVNEVQSQGVAGHRPAPAKTSSSRASELTGPRPARNT